MALTFSQIAEPVQLAASAGVLYTMPTSPATSVLLNGRVRLTNTSAGPIAVTLYADASGNASAASNECLPGVSIAANGYLDVDVPQLKAGDTLRGLAGTASVITMHWISGTLYS